MTPESISELLLVGFIAGWLSCWPTAYRRGKLAAARHMDVDPDDDEWWSL